MKEDPKALEAKIAALTPYQFYQKCLSSRVRSRLDEVLAGRMFAPLDLLLAGGPPGGCTISADLVLFSEHVRVAGGLEDLANAALHASLNPDVDLFVTMRGCALAAGIDDWAHRADYYASVYGDCEAAARLRDYFWNGEPMTGAFLIGLRYHANDFRHRTKHFYARPGTELHILALGIREALYDAGDAKSVLDSAETWMHARVGERDQASDEAFVHAYEALVWTAQADAVDALDNQATKKVAHDAKVAAAIERRKTAKAHPLTSAPWPKAYRDVTDDEFTEALARLAVIEDRPMPAPAEGEDTPEWRYDIVAAVERYDAMLEENARLDRKDASEESYGTLEDLAAALQVPQEPLPQKKVARVELTLEDKAPGYPGLIVLAALDSEKSKASTSTSTHTGRENSEFLKGFASIAGVRTPLTCVGSYDGGLTGIRHRLLEAYPHAVEVIDGLLVGLEEGESIRLRPTLLVGGPGTGKTSLLREFVRELNLRCIVFPCASVGDGSFGGTPAQWSTRRCSVPLELIRSSGCANPVVFLDEIEKTGISQNNGSLLHALLPMLERHTAEAYFETGLERNADLSQVGFLATANSLDTVPAPLRDRFRVVQMPDPGPEHIADIARRIVDEILADRGLDERWSPPLAPDEIDVIRQAWGSGSLRRLRRAVEATLDAREAVRRPQ